MAKVKTRSRGFWIILLLALIIIGVVVAIIIWPKKPDGIKNNLNVQSSQVLKADGEFMTNFKNYGEYSKLLRESDESASLKYNGVLNIYTSLTNYFDYMSYVFEGADFAEHDMRDVNSANAGMNNSKTNINNISKFLKDKNQTLTVEDGDSRKYQIADATLVWDNINPDVKSSIENYRNATENIAKIYNKNIKQGVYANVFAEQVANGVAYYLTYFTEKYDNLATSSYFQMTVNFKNFVTNYLVANGSQRVVAKYLTSTSLQTTASQLDSFTVLFPSNTLRALVNAELLQEELPEYTEEQKAGLQTAKKFFKGEITA